MILFKFWAFLVFLAVYLAIYVPQSKKEEKVLEEKFGEEYLRYRSATPKYLPKLSGLFKFEDHLSCLKLSWVKKEAPSLVVTIVIIFVAEIFSDRMLFGSQETIDELAELSLGLVAFIIATMIIVAKKQNRHKR
jgi:Ca2+/Na+ antiporter